MRERGRKSEGKRKGGVREGNEGEERGRENDKDEMSSKDRKSVTYIRNSSNLV